MSRFAEHRSQRDKPSTTSYRPSTARTTTTTTTTSNPTRIRDRPALLQSRYAITNNINNDENVTDELPALTQAPLFQTRTRGAPRLGITGTSATGKEDLARIGSTWKTTMGDKTLDAEIDKAIGGDVEEDRMRRLLKRTSSGDSAGRKSAESRRSWDAPGRSREDEVERWRQEEESERKKREEEARADRLARDRVETRPRNPLRTTSYFNDGRRLEELQQKLKRERAERKKNGLLDSDFAKRIVMGEGLFGKRHEQEQVEEHAAPPPSSPPDPFFRYNKPTVEDAPATTDNFGFFESRKQSDAARERRQKRAQERQGGLLEKRTEPLASQQQDAYLHAHLADRRAQRQREQEEREEQRRAQRLQEQKEREERQRQSLQEQKEREERQRQREADRKADEEEAARRAAERKARQDQVAVLREKTNWSNANTNRFGTGLFTTNGTGKAPAQTRRRHSPPPPLPSKEQEQRPKSPPPRQQPSYQPINREIGINKANLLEETEDEEPDHPQHQSEQSGTVEVPIPGTPAVLVKNSRKFWDKGKKKEEETTDTWTKLTRLAQTSVPKEEIRKPAPSPIPEERSSQLVPPSPPPKPDEKPETAVLERMEDLEGLGLNSTYPSDSTISSAGGREGEDDSFSATRELEQRLGISPPTDGETSDTEKEETQYFDIPSQQPTPPPEQPKRPIRKPSPTRRPVGEPIRPGATGRATSRPTKPRPRTPSPPTETASLDLNSPTLSLQHNHQPRRRSASPTKPTQKKPTPPPVSPYRPYDTDTSPDDTANETQLLLGINKKLRHVRSEVRNAHDGIENLERTLVTLEAPGAGEVTLAEMCRRAARSGRGWIWRWRFWLAWPFIWGCWVLGELLWIFWKLPPMYAGHVQGTGVPDVVLEDDAVWRYGIVGNVLRWGHEYFDYGGYAIGC